MKNWTKQFFVAAVAISALTACSDSNFSDVESGALVNPEQAMNSAVLTNASGQLVSTVPGDFGTYYLNIKTDGIWYKTAYSVPG